ncbi:trigger factor [soil metagenome]
MNTELIEVSPTQREIKIEISPDAVREVYNKVSNKYTKQANVPGFRKGFAPLDVVRLRFKDEINNETLQQLLPAKITEAIQEHNLSPLSEPHVHLEDQENLKLNGSQSVTLSVHFDVMPEIPEPDYKGVEVTRRARPVEDGQIEDIIAERRQQGSALIPVEGRKSEEGDTVLVDLEGIFENEPETEPIKADDLEIPLGDQTIEKAFTENLIGVEEDEEKEFTIAYPEDFSSPGLAGKTVNYKAKIKSVGAVELPELNDEWAQSLDEGFDTMDDLRKRLREDLESYSEADANARLRVDAIAKLIEKNDFEVPKALIDVQARNLLNNFGQDLAHRGVDLSKVENDFVQMVYEQLKTQAERDVRGAMLLEKIADLENIEVSADEVNEEIQKMADYYGTTVEEIKKSFQQNQNAETEISNNLRTRKAIEALIENAKVTDGEWIEPSQEELETALTGEQAEAEIEAETEEKPKEQKKAKAKETESEEKKEPKGKSKKAGESEE